MCTFRMSRLAHRRKRRGLWITWLEAHVLSKKGFQCLIQWYVMMFHKNAGQAWRHLYCPMTSFVCMGLRPPISEDSKCRTWKKAASEAWEVPFRCTTGSLLPKKEQRLTTLQFSTLPWWLRQGNLTTWPHWAEPSWTKKDKQMSQDTRASFDKRNGLKWEASEVPKSILMHDSQFELKIASDSSCLCGRQQW